MPLLSRKTVQTLKYVAGIACFVVIIAITAFIRFSNPAMTETQLLINFWWVWIVVACVAVVGVILTGK